MILLRGGKATEVGSQPIGQATSLMILVMVVGISAFLWYTGRLRSRAAMLTLVMIIAFLAYFAFWTDPVTSG